MESQAKDSDGRKGVGTVPELGSKLTSTLQRKRSYEGRRPDSDSTPGKASTRNGALETED